VPIHSEEEFEKLAGITDESFEKRFGRPKEKRA
jgi:hypothetical protein